MRRAFTMIELMVAVLILGTLTTYVMLTFHGVSNGWMMTTDYLDKLQRTDYAFGQVISALRSMYIPHDGKSGQYGYGFMLTDGGDGEDVDSSDVIEWSKVGNALVGNAKARDTDHRVQLRMCREGDKFGDYLIRKTGLYARVCADQALRPTDDSSKDYGFDNDELYEPVLVADGIAGFNCRVLPTNEKIDKENDKREFEDTFDKSNAVPYKVELTFYMTDPEGKSYRTNTAPVIRIVRLPLYEQAQDRKTLPGDEGDKK